MEELKQRIVEQGQVLPGGVIKVGDFLNHMIDAKLADKIAAEFVRRFDGVPVTKVLTVEASGIAFGVLTALRFGVPLVFAKKNRGTNSAGDDYYQAQVHSYTKNTDYAVTVSKKYICPEDHVLIVDDFLALGAAAQGLMHIVAQAGAQVSGVGIVIEKAYEPGGERLRAQGVRVESLARISSIDGESITFADE
ncbi:MAG: xanthine phosphoribosyltransferase [Eubacteriales bacterium]|nr:xanthine phosphoribosyltransferase [Eubacteriales bacterium]